MATTTESGAKTNFLPYLTRWCDSKESSLFRSRSQEIIHYYDKGIDESLSKEVSIETKGADGKFTVKITNNSQSRISWLGELVRKDMEGNIFYRKFYPTTFGCIRPGGTKTVEAGTSGDFVTVQLHWERANIYSDVPLAKPEFRTVALNECEE